MLNMNDLNPIMAFDDHYKKVSEDDPENKVEIGA
jgi:hypothetical protein